MIAICVTSTSWATPEPAIVPGSAAIEDLELTADYLFELEDAVLESAEIYSSKRHVAYLVVTPRLASPLLISPRGQSVQTVWAERLTRGENSASLEADFPLEYLGEYQLEKAEMVFEVDGKTARLKPAPPLLGHQSSASLSERDPKLASKAEAYSMKSGFAATTLPVAGDSVRIRVYFGSWSEICNELVPKIMQVEEQWRSEGVRFEYYGLPRPLTDDQVAVRDGILGVPTAIVYVDDVEVGRLSGRPLNTPEASLYQVLAGGGSE
ncbi:MAG: hypothetical protein GY719_34485 [bacterium]|nr:hypothetical protein [bacterium]